MATRRKDIEKRNELIVVDDSAFKSIRERNSDWGPFVPAVIRRRSTFEVVTFVAVVGPIYLGHWKPEHAVALNAFGVAAYIAYVIYAAIKEIRADRKVEPRDASGRSRTRRGASKGDKSR